jgi:hypothetical protein
MLTESGFVNPFSEIVQVVSRVAFHLHQVLQSLICVLKEKQREVNDGEGLLTKLH